MATENVLKTKQEPGLSDLLLYGTLADEGVMELKNGSLLAGYWYEGPDLEAATTAEVESLSAYIGRGLLSLDAGWMLHVEVIRKPAEEYPEGFFREPTNRLIDLERRAFHQREGAHFETKTAFFFTWMPPLLERSGRFTFLLDWFFGASSEEVKDAAERNIQVFKERLQEIQDVLTSTRQIKMRRMKWTLEKHENGDFINDELLQALNYVMNGTWIPVRTPLVPTYLGTLLARDTITGYPLLYDDKYLVAVSVLGYPQESFPGILHALAQLPFVMRWSNRFIFTDYRDASGKLTALRRRWHQKMRSFWAQIFNRQDAAPNLDALAMVDDIDQAVEPLNSGHICYGHHTCTVVVRGENQEMLETRAREVVKIFERAGFPAKMEKRNGMEAFIGSLPGHGYENVRKPFISSLNFVDIIHATTDWPGDEYCPSSHYPPNSPVLLQAASIGATPFRLNLFDGDVGHTLILGPIGAGKSTLLSTVASQFERYPGARIFAFDIGYSMYPLAKSCIGAVHYDIGTDDCPIRLCPLASIDTNAERMAALDWLEALLVLQGHENISSQQRNLLFEALNTLATTTDSSEERTMTHFYTSLQDVELRRAYEYYIGDRPGAYLFDGDRNDIEYRDFTVFELERLFGLDEKLLVPAFLHLFHQVETRLQETVEGKPNPPSMILLDEAWMALKHPMFREKLREWLLVLRKKNCAVVLATQDVNHIVESPIAQTIFDSCLSRVILPNSNARSKDLKKLYMDSLRLNEKQIDIISEAVMKRHYYYANPNSRKFRLFDLGLGPVALSFVGAANKDDLKAVRRLSDQYGETWPAEWLRLRELPDWADLWLEYHEEHKSRQDSAQRKEP